jgi:ATP-dependent exoDNAse (exonuclease V) alpha subunit
VLNLEAGEYARVEHVSPTDNRLTVRHASGDAVTYDPRRLHGVTIYREADRAFAKGDRVQFTAPVREHHIANRELGTIEQIDARGEIRVKLDSGRSLPLNQHDRRHLDHGYAVTSHSSQGQTADRVLVQIDTDRSGKQLVNRRFAYVAVSRGRYDAQIYTNDKPRLAETLSRETSHGSALESEVAQQRSAETIEGPAEANRAVERVIVHGIER